MFESPHARMPACYGPFVGHPGAPDLSGLSTF